MLIDGVLVPSTAKVEVSGAPTGANDVITKSYLDANALTNDDVGIANGLAALGSDGKLAIAQVPAIAITDTFVVSNQSAMLALTAEVGDVCVRTDLNKSFILKTEDASILANWQELLTPTTGVSSVAGRTGAVTLTAADLTSFASAPYDIAFSTFGVNTNSEVLFRMKMPRAAQIPANFSGSIASAGVAATASAVYLVTKNGSQVGTITFGAGQTTGTFSTQAAISLAIGDTLAVVAPASADATLADVDVTLAGTLA